MKKITMFLIIMILTLTMTGCLEQTNGFDEFVDALPNEITKDYKLPGKYLSNSISWYVDDIKLENNLLKYIYTTEDKKIIVTGIVNKEQASKNITIIKTNFVPKLEISTTDGKPISSKDEYKNGVVRLKDAGSFDLTAVSMRVKGRGNSTWGYEKKPYRIKFDQRTSLLGMAEAKDYVLLAEHSDKSLMRNYVAHYFSSLLNIGYSLETRYVNLYVNGEYQGVYLLTEQVKVDKNRLNIDVSEDTDGGFLIELERDYSRVEAEGVENVNWFRMINPNPNDRNNGGNPNAYQEIFYVVKSPDMEDFESQPNVINNKIAYYKNYFASFENSVSNDKYEDYIDVDSFIDYFILMEFMKNVDVGYSSVFIYKDKDQKMKMGPIWDFDISSGNGNYYPYGPKGFWVDYNPWFGILIARPQFATRFIARFNEVMNLYFDVLMAEIDRVELLILESALENFERWEMFGTSSEGEFNPNPPEMIEADTYPKQVKYLKDYLTIRKEWLIKNLNEKGYFGFLGEEDEGNVR